MQRGLTTIPSSLFYTSLLYSILVLYTDTTIYGMSVMCVRAIISVTTEDTNKYFIERRLKTENIGTACEDRSKYRIDLYTSYWVFL